MRYHQVSRECSDRNNTRFSPLPLIRLIRLHQYHDSTPLPRPLHLPGCPPSTGGRTINCISLSSFSDRNRTRFSPLALIRPIRLLQYHDPTPLPHPLHLLGCPPSTGDLTINCISLSRISDRKPTRFSPMTLIRSIRLLQYSSLP